MPVNTRAKGLEKFHHITAGTVTASKALVVDSNKDLTGIRNLTITGNLVSGSNTLSNAELAVLDGITAGTATASKAVVIDSSKNIAGLGTVGLAAIDADSGTATASAGAATLNKMAGKITTNSMTTAAGSAFTLTITNSTIASTDMVFASVNYGGAGIAKIRNIAPGSGSVVITIHNSDAAASFNATAVVSFLVIKA